MTVIAAMIHEGHIYMTGDTCVQDGDRQYSDPAGKIWQSGGMLIGAAGQMRVMQRIRYGLDFTNPSLTSVQNIDALMRLHVPRAIQEFARYQGLYPKRDDGIERLPIDLLIGYCGRMWEYEADLCAVEVGPLAAIGSGGMAALGALECLPNSLSPFTALRHAAHTAEKLCSGVGGPFTQLTTTIRQEETL